MHGLVERQAHESPVKMKNNSRKPKRPAEAKTSRTAQRKGDYVQRRVRRRSCATISNDISEGMPATKDEILRVLMWERKHSQTLQNKINDLELDAVRLKIAMDALGDITEIPRAGRAGRLAKAVVRFIECVKPVSFAVSVVSPPNDQAQARRTGGVDCK